MPANADPNPYATIERVRSVIASGRAAADEMEKQRPGDVFVHSQVTGARTALDMVEAALHDSLRKLAVDRGMLKEEEEA